MVAVMSSFSFESMVSMTMTLVTCYHHHYYYWCYYYCCYCYYCCHCCFVIVRVENGVETALVSIFHSRRVAINDLLAAVVVVDSLLFFFTMLGDQMDTGVKSQVLLLLSKYVPEFFKCSTRNG